MCLFVQSFNAEFDTDILKVIVWFLHIVNSENFVYFLMQNCFLVAGFVLYIELLCQRL